MKSSLLGEQMKNTEYSFMFFGMAILAFFMSCNMDIGGINPEGCQIGQRSLKRQNSQKKIWNLTKAKISTETILAINSSKDSLESKLTQISDLQANTKLVDNAFQVKQASIIKKCQTGNKVQGEVLKALADQIIQDEIKKAIVQEVKTSSSSTN